MSEPFIKLAIRGIKCDAPGCDYRDDDADFSRADEYLSTPCPKCGAPLLTMADLQALRSMSTVVALLNEAYGPVEEWARLRVPMEMDGSGVIRPRDGGQ